MSNVQLHCPTCGGTGEIEVSVDAVKNIARGLLAINIADGTICEHTFIAYIDRNLEVRDYFVADFHIEIPELPVSPQNKFKESKIPGKDVIDVDLIKLNIRAMPLTYIIKSIISKQKVVFVSDYEFLFDHLQNFFDYITHDNFDVDIVIMLEEAYNSSKKQYKDHIVLDNKKILRDSRKIINPKKLGVEKHIINRFLTEHELGYSYIVLKNEIQKAYELSNSIKEFIKEKESKKEKPNILEISSNLEHTYSIKINPIYLDFLIDIVKNYHGVVVPTVSQSFLGSL